MFALLICKLVYICQHPNNDFVKMPDAVLRFILRHCGVRRVRLIPQNSRALPAAFLRSHW
jgi:hypothetical protein